MELGHRERRREERFPIEAGATVAVNENDHTESAATVDISGCGVLLQFKAPAHVAVGDRVACDFSISHQTERPLPYWGVGNVVRVDGCRATIDCKAGELSPIGSISDDPSAVDTEPSGVEA